MRICVTGHRPNKLYGYDLSNPKWILLKEKFKELLLENNCSEAITGMALGVDTVFARSVLELKKEGYQIKLHCAIPCKGFGTNWSNDSFILYENILQQADIIKLVSDEYYRPYLMQKRNEYMVDRTEIIIAVWDGSSGGTSNCVRYAEKCNKEIIRITPGLLI